MARRRPPIALERSVLVASSTIPACRDRSTSRSYVRPTTGVKLRAHQSRQDVYALDTTAALRAAKQGSEARPLSSEARQLQRLVGRLPRSFRPEFSAAALQFYTHSPFLGSAQAAGSLSRCRCTCASTQHPGRRSATTTPSRGRPRALRPARFAPPPGTDGDGASARMQVLPSSAMAPSAQPARHSPAPRPPG